MLSFYISSSYFFNFKFLPERILHSNRKPLVPRPRLRGNKRTSANGCPSRQPSDSQSLLLRQLLPFMLTSTITAFVRGIRAQVEIHDNFTVLELSENYCEQLESTFLWRSCRFCLLQGWRPLLQICVDCNSFASSCRAALCLASQQERRFIKQLLLEVHTLVKCSRKMHAGRPQAPQTSKYRNVAMSRAWQASQAPASSACGWNKLATQV
jgi:hypothetical protein